jgi:3-methyladenine DNA glycosylase/8-oxoguanine DNA glycosylase
MSELRRASAELAARCGVMAKLVEQAGPCRLPRRPATDRFASLVRAIVSQQLQGQAARAIHARVVAALDGDVSPASVLRRRPATLREAGLSAAKEAAVRDLARKVSDGSLPLAALPRLPEAKIVEHLVQVRGIGPWTAEMFMIFHLRRLDVWPVSDYGVRRGYALAYSLRELPAQKDLEKLGEPFRPFRSVAAWYCWRATELLPRAG